MKKIIALLIFALCSMSLFAEDYQIYELYKSAYVKSANGNKWKKAKLKMKLNSSDQIMLSEDARIKLLEMKTGKTYEWKKEGTIKVGDVVRECLKIKSNWLKQLFSTVIDNITDSPIKIWWETGVQRKGQVDIHVEQVLAKQIKDFREHKILASPELTLSRHDINDNEFYFNIHNNSSDTLYVNVLAVNKEHNDYSILYDIRENDMWMILPVPSHSLLSLTEFILCKNTAFQYVVFGTRTPILIEKFKKQLEQDVSAIDEETKDGDIIIGTTLNK